MMNIVPRLMIARASNGFIVVIVRDDGPKLLVTISKEQMLLVILDEIDRLTRDPEIEPLIESNGHERNMQMLAKALGVPLASVKDAIKEQIGISPFQVEEDGA